MGKMLDFAPIAGVFTLYAHEFPPNQVCAHVNSLEVFPWQQMLVLSPKAIIPLPRS